MDVGGLLKTEIEWALGVEMSGRDRRTEDRERLKERMTGLFSYFRLACKRLELMHETPAAEEDIEQAGYAYLDSIILACCYLDALSVFRFGEQRGGKNFICFLQAYPNAHHCNYYRKVSSLYLDQPPLDQSGNLRSFKHGDPAQIRRTLYGTSPSTTDEDLSIDEAFHRLAQAGIQVTKEELNKFSYAAYFYERYRCYGVHHVQPPTPDISGRRGPYYATSPERLVFPRRFVLDTLSAAIKNFEAEVLSKIDAGEGPNTPNNYRWFKETYGLRSRFIETVLAYYKGSSLLSVSDLKNPV